MATITDAPSLIRRPRTWADDTFHENRAKPVAVTPQRVYDSHMVFHTVWRNDTPKGVHMQVTSDEPIKVSRPKREPKVNPFDAHIVAFSTAYTAESGKSGRVTLAEGDVLSGVIRNLRKSAKAIDRTVVLAYDPGTDSKTATTFRFMLKPKVAPKAKPDHTAAVVDAVVTSAKSGPNAAATKANARKR